MDRPPRNTDAPDRSRLQQVQQTDLTEARINEDFLYWLKNSGPTYLLGIMVVLCLVLGYHRWTQYKADKVDSAWHDLASVEYGLPSSLEEVADEHSEAKVGAVSLLARLAAANGYLRAVQMGQDLVSGSATADAPPPKLSEEDRGRYLDRAQRLYERIVADGGSSPTMAIHAVNGLFGLAAVEESRGNVDKARNYYEQAAAKAEAMYPDLAATARDRAKTADRFAQVVSLPSESDLPTRDDSQQQRRPANIDENLRKLLFNEPTMIAVP